MEKEALIKELISQYNEQVKSKYQVESLDIFRQWLEDNYHIEGEGEEVYYYIEVSRYETRTGNPFELIIPHEILPGMEETGLLTMRYTTQSQWIPIDQQNQTILVIAGQEQDMIERLQDRYGQDMHGKEIARHFYIVTGNKDTEHETGRYIEPTGGQ